MIRRVASVVVISFLVVHGACVAEFTTVIEVPPVTKLPLIGPDTQINIRAGGKLGIAKVGTPSLLSPNIEINITAARINMLESYGADINIDDGFIGDESQFFGGSIVLTDGYIGQQAVFDAVELKVLPAGRLHRISGASNSVIELDGGVIESGFWMRNSTFNLNSGVIERGISIWNGSVLNIRSGIINDLAASDGSRVNIYGTYFALNGEPVSGPVDMPPDSYLTAMLADGRMLLFQNGVSSPRYGSGRDHFDAGTLNLIVTSEASAPITTINAPQDPLPLGLRPGQTLNLAEGATVPQHFVAEGATINVTGGRINEDLKVAGTEVNLVAGRIGRFIAVAGSTINIDSGFAGGEGYDPIEPNDPYSLVMHSRVNVRGGSATFTASQGAVVRVSGGAGLSGRSLEGSSIHIVEGRLGGLYEILGGEARFDSVTGNGGLRVRNGKLIASDSDLGSSFSAESGADVTLQNSRIGTRSIISGDSVVNMHGGGFGLSFDVHDRATFNLYGGRTGEELTVHPGGRMKVYGDNFALNGQPVTGVVNLASGDVLTGVLTAGSNLLLSSIREQQFAADSLELIPSSAPSYSIDPIEVSAGVHGTDLLPGQRLHLHGNGKLAEGFVMNQAQLTVNGGIMEGGIEAIASSIRFRDGRVEDVVRLFDGSTLVLEGGTLRDGIQAFGGGRVTLLGGVVGRRVELNGSSLIIAGDVKNQEVIAREDSQVEIHDGTRRTKVSAGGTSRVTIVGGQVDQLQIGLNATADLLGGDIASLLAAQDVTLNITAREVFIDGVAYEPLVPLGVYTELLERDVIVSGILADGTPFGFGLGTSGVRLNGVVAATATVNVRLVPEPSALSLVGLGSIVAVAMTPGRRRRLGSSAFKQTPAPSPTPAVPRSV